MNKTSGFLLIILLHFFLLNATAQNLIVLDRTTFQPLENVVIASIDRLKTVTTNSFGKANLSQFSLQDTLFICAVGFQPVTIRYPVVEAMLFRVLLTAQTYSLDEVVVSASRFEEKLSDIPQHIEVINARDIDFKSQQTGADVLQSTGNIFVQKSQLGGGSPILRGFEANKVLLVVDGVRMNNAIYRSGHLQNILSLDNSSMDRMEVVFGPGSVVYGSDALGGVIHFHTKNPVLSQSDSAVNVHLHAFSRYASANQENTGHADFNIGFRKVAFLTNLTYSNFDDLRQGRSRNPFYGDWGLRKTFVETNGTRDTIRTNFDPAIQALTGYFQYNFLEKILFRQSKAITHVFNWQYSNSSNMNFYSRLTQMKGGIPEYAEWYYGPQKWEMASYQLNLTNKNLFYDNAKILLAWQDLEESRHSRKFQDTVINRRIENLTIYSISCDFDRIIVRNEIRYGLDWNQNLLYSSAYKENILNGDLLPLSSRYPDGGSTMRSLAFYATHTNEISEKLILTDGLRYSRTALHSEFAPYQTVDQQSGSLTGNFGFILMPGFGWRFTVNGSSGFRAPNVDDLSKIFESVPGNVIVPNPALKPEYTYTGETGISKKTGDYLTVECIGFYTIYKNAITTQPFLYNGEDSIVYDSVLSRVTANVNALEAYLYGFSGNLIADITNSFSIESSLNYTYGRIKTDSIPYPLDHIPPLYGKTSIHLKLDKFRGEFFVMYNGWKKIDDYNIYGEDNVAQATGYGTPAWVTLNLRTAYQVDPRFQIQLSIENILDQYYRVFASGISAPGKNLMITLRGRL